MRCTSPDAPPAAAASVSANERAAAALPRNFALLVSKNACTPQEPNTPVSLRPRHAEPALAQCAPSPGNLSASLLDAEARLVIADSSAGTSARSALDGHGSKLPTYLARQSQILPQSGHKDTIPSAGQPGTTGSDDRVRPQTSPQRRTCPRQREAEGKSQRCGGSRNPSCRGTARTPGAASSTPHNQHQDGNPPLGHKHPRRSHMRTSRSFDHPVRGPDEALPAP